MDPSPEPGWPSFERCAQADGAAPRARAAPAEIIDSESEKM
jgi:hypothetical protein